MNGSLKQHLMTVHEKIKNHKCRLCNKSFGHKWILEGHLQTVHGKRRDFSCDVCSKKLVSNFILKRHIQIFHTNIKLKSTKNKTSKKIQPVEQNSNAIAKVEDPNFDTIIPKLDIADSKSIVKCQL